MSAEPRDTLPDRPGHMRHNAAHAGDALLHLPAGGPDACDRVYAGRLSDPPDSLSKPASGVQSAAHAADGVRRLPADFRLHPGLSAGGRATTAPPGAGDDGRRASDTERGSSMRPTEHRGDD